MDRPLHAAVLEALSADQQQSESWRVDVALEQLEVSEALREMPLKQLSGGWQRFAMLARVLVTEADVLLLDEPTNHLDLARIGQLEIWLNALPREMPVVIASHDRAFLDATTNRTLFLRPEASQMFSLPFTPARAALREADASTNGATSATSRPPSNCASKPRSSTISASIPVATCCCRRPGN